MTNTDVAVQQQDKPPIVVLRERLQARQGELKAALTDVPPEQFIRAVMTSASLNPEILGCTWQSIWNSCLQACRDGLLPDGVEGAIVPFKSRATWIPMYQGLLRRFRRSGQFKWVTAGLVREGEEFQHYIDENGEHFRHVPGDSVAAPITKIYALATTKDGGVFVAVMPIAEANKIKAMSRTTREDSPWRQWEGEMLKKTALRRLSKMLPSARDIIGEEEDIPAVEAPAATVVPMDTPRAGGPAAALDRFAEQPSQPPPADEAADVADERGAVVANDRVPAADEDKSLAMRTAYERGVKHREAGYQKKEPGEYRDPSRTREALAWRAGFDGQPMPEFSDDKTAHKDER